jgi:hypothetical protein
VCSDDCVSSVPSSLVVGLAARKGSICDRSERAAHMTFRASAHPLRGFPHFPCYNREGAFQRFHPAAVLCGPWHGRWSGRVWSGTAVDHR